MPDYASLEYWLSRFQKENHFEWLGAGDTLLPHIARAFGQTQKEDGAWFPTPGQNNNTPKPAKILHIGCGTSQLSLRLRLLVPAPAQIINIDFVESCLIQLRQLELNAFGDVKMDYEQLDILTWESVAAKFQAQEKEDTILIIDKSTSDAISCGPDIPSPFSPGPAPPVEILAFHLAALSAPGSTWLALSYSASRFDDIGELWSVERKEKVAAASGQSKKGVWAPEVWHTLFVLKRTETSMADIIWK